ncbi:putative hexosyltransferase MUCI70 [Trifolium repens]|nr:putative hexosyltransferase MUCI70 [Trifolium repens]KAK2449247.1 putative hexosyltransferase MUCI70 [Trifolium repens]
MQKDHQKQGIPHTLIVLNGYVRGVRLGVTPSPMFGLGVTIFIMANMKKKKKPMDGLLWHCKFAKCVEIGLPALIIMVFISQKVHRQVVGRTDCAGLLSAAAWLILFFEGKHGFQNVVEVFAMMAASLVSLFEVGSRRVIQQLADFMIFFSVFVITLWRVERVVPNDRYSIWLDGKLELVVDPYQILERFVLKLQTHFYLQASSRFDSSSFKYSASDSFNEASDSFFPRIPSNIQLLLQIRHSASASASSFWFI